VGHNAVGVVFISERVPKVGAGAPPLGWRPQSLWDWKTPTHFTILLTCHNPFPPFTFIWSSPPKTGGHSCAANPRATRSIRISAAFPNKSTVRRFKSVEWKTTSICSPRFGRTITQAEWVKELKRVSNLWVKERGRDYADFEWQGGYADFSVSQSNLEQVKQHIAGQEEHHRKMSFQDELRALLRKHEIEWEEKYVWD
jgi:hypothetical protein